MVIYPVGSGAAGSFCGCPLYTSNVERFTASVAASRGSGLHGVVLLAVFLRILGVCAFV